MTTTFLGDAAASNVDNPANYDAEEEEFADIAAMVYLGKMSNLFLAVKLCVADVP